MQRKRPSRMDLSHTVARPPPTRTPAGKPVAKRETGPFGATNRTTAGFRLEEERRKREEYRLKMKERRDSEAAPADGRPPAYRTSGTRGKRPKQARQPGDMKALKMQKSLSSIPYGHRANIKKQISEIESFDDFNLLPVIQKAVPEEALKGLAEINPTPIQRLAIPALLGMDGIKTKGSPNAMKQFLLAAETGSGKTLAYLIPTLDAIKRADMTERQARESEDAQKQEKKLQNVFALDAPPLSNEINSDAGRPKAIVLLPTSELVEQVGKVFKSFSHAVKLRVCLLSASYSATIIRNRLFGPAGVDVVLSTPHLLSSIAESDPNILSRVTHLIADEADSLFDRGFAPLTTSIIDRATPSLKQLILCSATIPRSLDGYLQKRFPDIQRLATPNLHAIPRRVQLSVTDIDREPYRGNRDLACADTIWQIGRAASEQDEVSPSEAKRVVVFVNERETAAELSRYLLTKGIDAVALNRDTLEQRRDEILSAFTSAAPMPISNETTEIIHDDMPKQDTWAEIRAPRSQRILANTKVIVMTDIGSRGIDTIAVRNVILYDVPHTTIDFIHRLGRTGRMGRRGRGFVLVGKNDRRDVVREVREGMFRGQALI